MSGDSEHMNRYFRHGVQVEEITCLCCVLVESPFYHFLVSLVAQRLKHLPGIQETQVSREDPLEKAMATHSSTLAWRIPWREEPGRLQSMGLQRVGHD